ncbi:MAG: hypothetical protein Q7U04_16095 [Bacteriovorax sp.]|nr:hypothetical protein [Bacteriovorax sp.]
MKKNISFFSSKRIFALLVCLIFSASCRLSQKLGSSADNSGVGAMRFPGPRNLVDSELKIGRRMCTALKQKQDHFQTFDDRTEQVKLQASFVDCKNIKSSETFIATISKISGLQYSAIPERENYFRDVVTDQTSALATICSSVPSSDNVSNTVIIGLVKYTVVFLIENNFDRVQIKKEISDSRGNFSLSGAEAISVITNGSQAEARFMGVEQERTRLTSCEGNIFKSMTQTWVQALTHF